VICCWSVIVHHAWVRPPITLSVVVVNFSTSVVHLLRTPMPMLRSNIHASIEHFKSSGLQPTLCTILSAHHVHKYIQGRAVCRRGIRKPFRQRWSQNKGIPRSCVGFLPSWPRTPVVLGSWRITERSSSCRFIYCRIWLVVYRQNVSFLLHWRQVSQRLIKNNVGVCNYHGRTPKVPIGLLRCVLKHRLVRRLTAHPRDAPQFLLKGVHSFVSSKKGSRP